MLMFIAISCSTFTATAQSVKTELYDLVKSLLYDSTGFENVGDWGVGNPKKFAVKWKADRIEMSPDTSINFFRMGTADVVIGGRSLVQASGKPVVWTLMLKGPRMGYASFSMISSQSNDLHPKYTIDSIFGKRPFTAKLLRSCDAQPFAGYYYYEVKLPKKDLAFIKISWLTTSTGTALRIDGYDSWSNYAVKLACPK